MILKLDPGERLLYRGRGLGLRHHPAHPRRHRAVAMKELGLDVYPNQIEIITAEQMLDAYRPPACRCSTSTGPSASTSPITRRCTAAALADLAYEIVINSNPCITYIMEENTATMQALVIAHAAFGHNHFFKNNYLFKQWTDADGILDYLDFAKGYIAECEERYGHRAGGAPARRRARADEPGGAPLSAPLQARSARPRRSARASAGSMTSSMFNDLWRTVPAKKRETARAGIDEEQAQGPAATAAGEHSLLPGEDRAEAAARGSARSCASSGSSRSISIRSARPR